MREQYNYSVNCTIEGLYRTKMYYVVTVLAWLQIEMDRGSDYYSPGIVAPLKLISFGTYFEIANCCYFAFRSPLGVGFRGGMRPN